MNYALPFAGFVVSTFIYAFCWHLIVFKKIYDDIGIYDREKPIIPIGVLTVLIQGFVFVYLYINLDFGQSVILKGTVLGLLLGIFEYCSGSLAFSAKRKIKRFRSWIIIQFFLSTTLFPVSGTVVGLIYYFQQ